MTAHQRACNFDGCVLTEDHANGFNDLHVRDVSHGPVTISYSLEGQTKTAAWVPEPCEYQFSPESISADLAELDELIAGLSAARTAIAQWVHVSRLRRRPEVDDHLRELDD